MSMIVKLGSAISLIVVMLIASRTVAESANFAGTWAVAGTGPRGLAISPVCVFKQDGNDITGSCKGTSYFGPVEGSVDGNSITWIWHGAARNSEEAPNSTATFNGTLESDGFIRGTWTTTNAPGARGTFSAQKP